MKNIKNIVALLITILLIAFITVGCCLFGAKEFLSFMFFVVPIIGLALFTIYLGVYTFIVEPLFNYIDERKKKGL